MLKSIGRHFLRRYRLANAARLNFQMLPALLRTRNGRAGYSWSQHGEDHRLVEELRASLQNGYYVDIGANHPAQNSNTYRLYNMGMRGVCVEPNEQLCALHYRYRPEDLLINAAIGSEAGLAKYYEMSYHGISTFSESEARMRQANGATLLRTSVKPVLRLETILGQCVPDRRTRLELMSVDTEGWDEHVLRSNDWNKHRPRLVIVEANTEDAAQTVGRAMDEFDYAPVATFHVNTLFHDRRVTATPH